MNTIVDHPLVAAATAVLLLQITYIVYERFFSPLARYPGPFLASFSNVWKFWQQYNNRMSWVLAELHEKYGPVVRTGPHELSFATPEANSEIYKSNWRKGELYAAFHTLPATTGVMSTQDNAEAMQFKRIFSAGFALPYIRKMEPSIDERFAVLRTQLDRFAESEKVFDLALYVQFLMADMMGVLSFGQTFGTQETEDANKLPPATEALAVLLRVGQLPWLSSIFTSILRSMPNPEYGGSSPAHKRVNKIIMDRITARKANSNAEVPDDMLSVMLASRESRTGQQHTPRQLFMASTELVFAGTDTTTNSVSILLSNLGRNKEALAAVRQELEAQLKPLKDNEAAYSFVGLEQKLNVMTDAIRESHRHNTISTFNMPRQVPVEGAVISGNPVPGGTEVFVNNYVLHRSAAIWGPDADKFDPTRWHDDRGHGKKDIVTPYLIGRRTCAGQNLAIALIYKTISTLLMTYDFEFMNADEPVVVRPVASGQLETPLLVKCRRRGDVFRA